MATKTAAAANAASDQAVALRRPLDLLNQQLAKLSAPMMLAVIEEGKELAASLTKADVLDEEDYQRVLERCKAAASIEKQLDEAFEPFVAAGNALHKGFIKWRDNANGAGVAELCKARAAAQRKCWQWRQQEELKQQQRLKAEQEERERQAEVQRLLDLEDLEAAGATDAAEELAAAPIAPVAPAVAPPPVVEKIDGTAYVPQWKYGPLRSFGARLRAIAARIREAMPPGMDGVAVELETLAEYGQWNEQAIGATVRALKQDCIPRMASVGIDVFDEGNMRVGAA